MELPPLAPAPPARRPQRSPRPPPGWPATADVPSVCASRRSPPAAAWLVQIVVRVRYALAATVVEEDRILAASPRPAHLEIIGLCHWPTYWHTKARVAPSFRQQSRRTCCLTCGDLSEWS